MKKNTTKKGLFLLLLAALLPILFIIRERRNAFFVSSTTPEATNNHEVSDGQPKQSLGEDTNSASSAKSLQTLNSNLRESKWAAAMNEHNVPVEFWGKVVDQNNVPLAGVKISTAIRHGYFDPISGPNSKYIKKDVISGSAGEFYIGNEQGDDLAIESVEKEGYELEPNAKRGFGYSRDKQAVSRSNAPVIFKMWNTSIHENLVKGQLSFHIVPDGRPYMIDILKGTITESGNGDLKVWIKRPKTITLGQRYDWSCQIEMINGGLLEETNVNSSMYSTPDEGYFKTFSFERKPGNGWGDSTGIKRFYVSLNGGQEFGRISIEMFAYYNDRIPGLIRIEYAINPSGSRILRN